MNKFCLALLVASTWCAAAHAQSTPPAPTVAPCVTTTGTTCNPVTSGNPLPVTGSFSASLAGFTPSGAAATPLAVTNSSARQVLPSGAVVFVQNTGSNVAYVALGDGAVTATTSNLAIPAGGGCALTVGANVDIAAITASSTATLNMQGGSGLGNTCYGGGSGGGGAVTVADGADATQGTKADAKSSATDTTAITIMQVLKEISAMVQAPPSQAVTNAGTFAAQATQSGTWTVQPGNTANTTAWKVDGSAATQPVSGAVDQGAAGTGAWPTYQKDSAGNDATDTTNHAVKVNVVAGGLAQGSTTSGQSGSLVLCATTTSAPSNTTAQSNALSCGTDGAQRIAGSTATNVAITDAPVNTGGQAVSSENTVVTTARKVQFVADLTGKQIVLPYANPENFVSGTTAAMTGTTSTVLLAAPASGLRNYVTQISCVNSHATVGTFVTVQDGSGGTALYTLAAAAVYGGSAYTLPTPLRQPTTATGLYVADVTTGANVICNATGYKGA